MFIVYVKHYLNHDGLIYFNQNWFPKVQSIMSLQKGYHSVQHEHMRDTQDCVNVTVIFETKVLLEAWADHPEHETLVRALDVFRSRQYWEVATTHSLTDSLDVLEWEKINV